MTEKSKKYVFDVLMAIDLIRQFTIDISDFNMYEKDRKTQSAVRKTIGYYWGSTKQIKTH